MALITCPECGQQISSLAKTCPHCGCPTAEVVNDIIRIKIDQNPQVMGYYVTIKEEPSKRVLVKNARSGSVVEINSDKEISIGFYGITSVPMLVTEVSPQNGGKYRATWGMGIFSAKISSCARVDVIDS